MAMAGSRMKSWFPRVSLPLVVSAPMDFVTNPRLATEVTKAGGLGFIQGGRDFSPDSPVLRRLDEQLAQAASLILGPASSHSSLSSSSTPSTASSEPPLLPIGVGFVTYHASTSRHFATTTLPILARHRPAAVWLFAPPAPAAGTEESALLLSGLIDALTTTTTTTGTRSGDGESGSKGDGGGWRPRVVVQVGTVTAAREAARAGADVLVAQGADAGGHQFAAAAGVVALVPEVCDMLRDEFPDRQVAVWAAGGIADGRGVAAALALGAEAAVLGTRYMVAVESDAQDYKRKAILSTTDGGANTAKSQIHDHVQGNKEWPVIYDGRALLHPSYHDDRAGVPLEDNAERFRKAREAGDLSRMVTWSGTAVGLVKREQPAAEITTEVREQASRVIEGLQDKTSGGLA
ncbi:FMN-dependent 2-nitropropane dioxygenase [Xylariaceae sp. FL0804]|nr:FMN-dependent 2-nitropropane dioxygenase [Xylariaceae sp. FL0804]